MTDHCLLLHFMNGTSWDDISCIIIDEAHQRSLNTDLLLALIKKELLKRPEFHLIIMSVTADATKFSDYVYGCNTYYVMGINCPLEIKYVADVSASPYGSTNIKVSFGKCASYVLDVLKMVSYIHKTEEDGVVLAFLTSQIEVEWACEIFTDPTALVMPMHGKLSVEEQRKVFQVYPGKRKVIFCTKIAETSLTIKVIKYVVDSGMVKQSRFEPSTGTNVLKVSAFSQSSANQGAGRAGGTEPGKCYRLYTESDFHAMKIHQKPEIRKLHLGIAVLRILALGTKNVDDFEFVDVPCPRAVEIAIQNLIHLGAVTRKGEVFDLTEC
ncbi:ATP-dependent RNA helicase DEAH11, chloroplastic-like [Zingiber officinale]|uniref:ATP-dependent RNA helicase DEAH11, chloroplastic-like n=1 Tax=Zingiber officinale TaxID=94328 RepID=UPI001C4B2E72|nr:ATP-dependent RNA helicase DEAH11, chloroplastic-like [Zingiber officinale]XP_042455969.1 ATP-dependent RNA helicase DEAH11, chloroplastic-like [Zingiber officinale]XP_042455970.1 ATP-dependent RNA helicase DEAH11, chloroplastic-like [Zingiber officinale]